MDGCTLSVATWNIAAINNNPFEFWVTHSDEEYNALMASVASFISEPSVGDQDVPISAVFTPEMFDQLKEEMLSVGWSHEDVAGVRLSFVAFFYLSRFT